MKKYENFKADKRSVLIIDDCPVYRSALKGMLVKQGFNNATVLVVPNALLALRTCQQTPMKLIICDYNLGEHANGYQLLDELIAKKLLPADCVIAIVTGDANKEVVRSFFEFEPDGYLVKPISYAVLAKRLPQIASKKLQIAPLLLQFANNEFDKVIKNAKKYIAQGGDEGNYAQYLSGQSYTSLDNLVAAEVELQKLSSGRLAAVATLKLAYIKILQGDFDESEALLNSLEKNIFYGAKAMEMKAELLFRQQSYESALQVINQSIALTPKNFWRCKAKYFIAYGAHNFIEADKALLRVIELSYFSATETVQLYLTRATIILDQAEITEDEHETKAKLKQFDVLAKFWRSNAQQKDYQLIELLLMCRLHFLSGEYSQAKECFQEYKALRRADSDYQPLHSEEIEIARVETLLNEGPGLAVLIAAYDKKNLSNRASLEILAIHSYLRRWKEYFKVKTNNAERLKTLGLKQFQAGLYELAVLSFIKSMKLYNYDREIMLLVLKTLTKSWPKGWGRRQVFELVSYCRAQLVQKELLDSELEQYITGLKEKLSATG